MESLEDRFMGVLSSSGLVRDGVEVPPSAVEAKLRESKLLALYLSASWCPPCRQFSPKLHDIAKGHPGDLAVVLISLDRCESDYEAYVKSLPCFYSVPYYTTARVDMVRLMQSTMLPTLFILDSHTGKIITRYGRLALTVNPRGCIDEWKKGRWGLGTRSVCVFAVAALLALLTIILLGHGLLSRSTAERG
eukprot:Sspe_Gene.117260::Locus_108092_Transcript_1_1_Confidence_1.000_Length_677::g.117260::m.117260/K17609/NXN; nucleoredoxin